MEDLTDNEREEQLRRWWSDNWLMIVAGVGLGLAVLGGYQWWQNNRAKTAEHDEAAYVDILKSLGDNKLDDAVAKAKALRDEDPSSPYVDQTELALARAAVDRRDFAGAAERLKTVADSSRDPELRQVAKTRLARVLIEQGKHDEALALLDVASAGSFVAVYHDLRGDAYAAKGDSAAARREYDSALAASTAEAGVDRGFIELKRDALPAATVAAAAPVAPAAAAPTGGDAK